MMVKVVRQNSSIKMLWLLVRAGLWENYDADNTPISVDTVNVDWNKVYQHALEQSVIGLIAAGLEKVNSIKPPQDIMLKIVGSTIQIEQRNKGMNDFIAELIDKMRQEGIYALVVKGQGIGQCYERPLWRVSGDIDLLLSEDNYEKAKHFLLSKSTSNKVEGYYSKHLGMTIGGWYVEIHGSLRGGLSSKMDREIDATQRDVFYNGNVRSWMNNNTQVFLPGVNEDVFFIFTHFVKHFYKEGLGLKQLCDWCRLLWKFHRDLDINLLEKRLKRSKLMDEWLVFSAMAVEYLGMPIEAMPLFSIEKKWHIKANKIVSYIITGAHSTRVSRWFATFGIFPINTIRFSPGILFNLNWLKVKERLFLTSKN